MAQSTTGKGPPHLRWPKLPADDPLFKRGYIFGIRRAADFAPRCQICGRPVDEHLAGAVLAGMLDRVCSECLRTAPLCGDCGRLVLGQPNLSLCADCRDSPMPRDEEQ